MVQDLRRLLAPAEVFSRQARKPKGVGLREQVRVLRPKVIVCLGRIAAQRLIDPEFRVTREHGQFVEKKGVHMMGTFHPAALLRNPKQKPDAFDDFLALRDKLVELGLQPPVN